MKINDLIGFVVMLGVALSMIGLSIPLLMGKCTGLIAGYNTMSDEEKQRWDGPEVAKFTGKILLVCALATLLFAIGLFLFDLVWLTWIYLVVVVGVSVFGVVYCNTGNHFQK